MLAVSLILIISYNFIADVLAVALCLFSEKHSGSFSIPVAHSLSSR